MRNPLEKLQQQYENLDDEDEIEEDESELTEGDYADAAYDAYKDGEL